jgi:Uncharacterised nucleotidyltransferase
VTAQTESTRRVEPGLPMLSRLLLQANHNEQTLNLGREEFEDTVALAHSHHVIVRSMEHFHRTAAAAGDSERSTWARNAIRQERVRIENAMSFLYAVCSSLQMAGYDAIVIKSLDHWPDLGSDLDLYTNADPQHVIRSMKHGFKAQLAARSWGDRLANKWNFILPGLPELVEVHIGRLGQTGEQVALANSLAARARSLEIEGQFFRVTGAEDRLMICTLQRMYRHFYARLCDIVDTAQLLETESIDYENLRFRARAAGIWDGLATFLNIVSGYVERYRGRDLALPPFVTSAARFGAEKVRFGRGFLRIPIVPHSAKLYASQLAALIMRGQVRSTMRLGLLPCLATAAAMGQKLTGSDKGIW